MNEQMGSKLCFKSVFSKNPWFVFVSNWREVGADMAGNGLFRLGIALGLVSSAVALASLVVNTHLESTERIQEEQDQIVVPTGI